MTLTKSQKARRRNQRGKRSQVPRPQNRQQIPASLQVARTRPNKTIARARAIQSSPAFSRAAQQYASCLSNPFNGPLAGIPDYPVQPSQKTRIFKRGTFSTGSADVGYVALNPYYPANDVAINVVGCPIWYTTSAFAGTTITSPAGAVTGALGEKLPNGPFASAQISGNSDDVNFRLVAAGLRARYIDTKLNQGGRYFAVQEPGHDGFNTLTVSSLGDFDNALVDVVGNEWVTVLHSPYDAGELAFSHTQGKDGAELSISQPYMAIGVIGPTGTPIAFEYEAFAVYEFIGTLALAKTATESDPHGFSAVLNAANSTTHLQMPHVGDSSRIQRNFLKDAWDFVTGKGGLFDVIDDRTSKAVDGIEKLLPLLLAFGL